MFFYAHAENGNRFKSELLDTYFGGWCEREKVGKHVAVQQCGSPEAAYATLITHDERSGMT